MKKLNFAFTVLFILFASVTFGKEFKIASLYTTGAFDLLVDKKDLLKNWNNNLKSKSGIDAKLTSLEIKRFEDGRYYAIAKGNNYISLTLLYVKNNDLYAVVDTEDHTITCTAKDCTPEKIKAPTESGVCFIPCDNVIKTTIAGGSVLSAE